MIERNIMADHKQALGVADIAPLVARAQGCLLGQLAGDALGSLVEFQSPATIRAAYPNGVRELAEGGCWNTITGQPTDDSEMALALARTLAEHGTYSAKRARSAYERWLDSDPFDAGCAVTRGLTGDPKPGLRLAVAGNRSGHLVQYDMQGIPVGSLHNRNRRELGIVDCTRSLGNRA